jgi:hypothetical protein
MNVCVRWTVVYYILHVQAVHDYKEDVQTLSLLVHGRFIQQVLFGMIAVLLHLALAFGSSAPGMILLLQMQSFLRTQSTKQVWTASGDSRMHLPAQAQFLEQMHTLLGTRGSITVSVQMRLGCSTVTSASARIWPTTASSIKQTIVIFFCAAEAMATACMEKLCVRVCVCVC